MAKLTSMIRVALGDNKLTSNIPQVPTHHLLYGHAACVLGCESTSATQALQRAAAGPLRDLGSNQTTNLASMLGTRGSMSQSASSQVLDVM